MEIRGVSNIGWSKRRENIMGSEPLSTSGYNMGLSYILPNTEYELKDGEFIVCLLRSSIISEYYLPLRKSLIVGGEFSLKSGEDGCLLFVCKDEGDNNKYLDVISGPKIEWFKYDTNMYRTIPQIHVDDYRINLWYLGPNKRGGIHNHVNEPIPFIEFHTQLRGNGWMVKYEDQQGNKESERIEMVRGYTHDLFCEIRNGKVVYPWHEYIAGEKGSLFVVFEDMRVY